MLLSCFKELLRYRQKKSGFGDKAGLWVDILPGVSEAEHWDESAQKCHQIKIAVGHSRVW